MGSLESASGRLCLRWIDAFNFPYDAPWANGRIRLPRLRLPRLPPGEHSVFGGIIMTSRQARERTAPNTTRRPTRLGGLLFLVGLWVTFGLGAALAQGPAPLGPVFEIDGQRQELNSTPRATVADDGSFIVVWHQLNTDDIVFGRRFAADGIPLGDEVQVNSYPGAFFADVEPIAGGGFVVAYMAWPDAYPAEQLWCLRGRRLDGAGQVFGEEILVEGSPMANAVLPNVATFDDGEFLVVWNGEEDTGGVFDDNVVRGRRFAADGEAQGESFLVARSTRQHLERADVLALEEGDFVIVWDALSSDSAIRGQHFAADGALLTSFQVNTETADVLTNPSLARRHGGGFVVAWTSYQRPQYGDDDPDYEGGSIRVRQFNGDGEPLGGEILVSNEGLDRFQQPTVADLGRDGFAVVWDTSPTSLRAFYNDGASRGATVQMPITGDSQASPTATGLAPGRFLVAWDRRVHSPFSLNVDGQIFSTRCQPSDTELCLGENGELLGDGAGEGRFRATVTWRDHSGRSGSGRVVATTSNGSDSGSGLFWFFSPDNWELLVKVVDGCAFNGHFWLFAAGITDVEYELTVIDTVTGEQRVYENTLGRSAPAVTDIEAFTTCP